MSISAYDFVHLALYAMDGEIDGKTKLQKAIYFLGLMAKQAEELGYDAHYYGPYSGQVTRATDRLSALGFVDSNTTVWGIDGRGFEQYKTSYKLTKDGRDIAEKKLEQNPKLNIWIKENGSVIKQVRKMNYMKLSIAAKTHYMLTKSGDMASSHSELVETAKRFGWSVSEDEILDAAEFLENLGLVKITKTCPNCGPLH